MHWLKNIKINSKLLLGFGLMAVILALVVVLAHRGITSIQDSQHTLYEIQFANATDLLDLRSNVNGIRTSLLTLGVAGAGDRAARDAARADIAQRHGDIDRTLDDLERRNADDRELLPQLQELKRLYDEYARVRDETQIPDILAGRADLSAGLTGGSQHDTYEKIRQLANSLGDVAVQRARAKVAEANALATRVVQSIVTAGVVAMLLGLAAAYFLNRIIATPLRDVSAAAQRIAAGDLTVAVDAASRTDELGDLGRAFGTMLGTLRAQLTELGEGAAALGTAANEISVSTSQLAASASETAAAVNETTTTVAEVRQTAQVSSQKAKAVSDSAQRAAQTSQNGRAAAADVVAGMARIRQQMEAIAASMGRLSEQSSAIGQIIATVEDLAAQSNLLAVNAAIEAAKAGEHGKGFGVVAAEVKSLAEQSRQATAQVRTLLNEIQKATTAAVMATEQGAKAVETGERQTNAASESIQTLAGGVSEAAQAATQIVASSQQQLAGVDQVATAMESIKQASTQNVASSKQLEVAARNLSELGGRLRQLVAAYKT